MRCRRFTLIGCREWPISALAAACETALWPEAHSRATYGPTEKAIEDAIDADPVAACVRELMAERAPGRAAPLTCCGSASIA